MESNNRIASLQVLRAVAFMGVFFEHSHFFFNYSGFSVSIFFVLSGFLREWRLCNKDKIVKETVIPDTAIVRIKEGLESVKRSVKGIYPLYIITMFLMLPLVLLRFFIGSGEDLVSNIVGGVLRYISAPKLGAN